MKRHGVVAGVSLMLVGCSDPLESTAVDDPAPAEVVNAQPAQQSAPPQAPPPRLTDRPAWWLDEPSFDETGFAATVEAEGASVLEARAAAVDLAMQAASTLADADSARIDKTLIINPRPGAYKAFVYVSCPATTTAQAPDSP